MPSARNCGIWFWSCFGYSLTGLIKDYQTRDLVLSVLLLPLTFSAPVFYSLDAAPVFLKIIGAVNPLTYQVVFVRDLMGGTVNWVALAVTVVCLLAISVIGVLSTSRMRRLSFEG
nr:ABC transporter permease [Bifidobacterium sp. DSM 109957]